MRFDKIEVIGKLWLHIVADKDTEKHRGPKDEGRLIYAQSQERVYFGNDSDWVLFTTAYDVFAANSKLLMGSFPLPTGWNIKTDNDDFSIMVTPTSGAAGTTDGSWIITGIDEQGSHNDHTLSGATTTVLLGASDVYTTVGLFNHSHTLIVDGLHDHTFDGTWRPAYVKFCEAEYQ